MKTENVTVDGQVYELTQLGAREGRRVLASLAQVIGPAIGEMANVAAMNEQAIGRFIEKLTSALDPDVFDELCDKFASRSKAMVGNKAVALDGAAFDVHFAGKYFHMMKWFWECLRLNFADFLDDNTLAQLRAVLAPSPSKSQKTSTGSSGES
jgi:hypothetical protein